MRRLADCIAPWSAQTPGHPAVTDEGASWTYRELAARVEDARRYLGGLGIGPGDRVMLVGENGVALAALILAAGTLDAWAVLENARRAPLEVDAIVRLAQPRRVVFVTANSPDAQAHAQRHGATAQYTPFGTVAAGAADAASVPEPVEPGPDQVATLIYTTGSTGNPKGVMLTHRNLLHIAGLMRALRRLTPQDRVYGVLPISHVMGLSSGLLGTLAAGAHIRLVPRFAPQACLEALAEQHITILQGAPAMFARLVKAAPAGTRPGGALRFIAVGGAPLDPTLKTQVQACFGLTLHNGYGLTEASGSCWTRMDEEILDCSVGPPTPGMEVSIRDGEGRPLAPGVMGQLWLRGPNVMKGYYREPGLTARALAADGWFNSEDLAIQGPDGRITITGRAKDLIIRSGFNVSPLEVEMALNSHAQVQQSAVLGYPVQGNEEIIAVVEPAPGGPPGEQALQAYLAERLSSYKRPTRIVFMEALPVASNGKILKQQLRQQIGDIL
jgi:acyl-CoA synthetase (AMP-forming)/AMP-acid ligase II